MFDFEINRINLQNLSAREEVQRKRFKSAEGRTKKALDELIVAIKPVCLRAIDKYNASTASLKIVPQSVKLSFGLENYQLYLYVELKWPSGSAPDEDLDGDDVKKVETNLRRFFAREFSKDKVPYKLATIRVPSAYFGK